MKLPVCSLLALALFAGCADQPGSRNQTLLPTSPSARLVAPIASSRSGFFPLEIGDKWTYDHVLDLRFADGTPVQDSPFRSTAEREVIGEENIAGQTYRVMEYRVFENQAAPIMTTDYYRQTKEALYTIFGDTDSRLVRPASNKIAGPSLDRNQGRAAAIKNLLAKREAFVRSLAGGVSTPTGVQAVAVEFPMLIYPLHPGVKWSAEPYSDESFTIDRQVEGVEVLDLPVGHVAAYRIRHTLTGLFGPNDYAYFWYSRDGFIGYSAHLESEAFDENGNASELSSEMKAKCSAASSSSGPGERCNDRVSGGTAPSVAAPPGRSPSLLQPF